MWVRPAVGNSARGAAGAVRDAGMTRSWMAVRAAPSGTKTAAAARIDARRVAVRRFNVAANVIGRALPFVAVFRRYTIVRPRTVKGHRPAALNDRVIFHSAHGHFGLHRDRKNQALPAVNGRFDREP